MKKLIRSSANLLGIDLVRLYKSPSKTLLGLSQMKFNSIIDVGSNEGQFASTISQFFPDARIFCFEPLAQPFERLSSWAATQHGRVKCFNMAVGDEEGEIIMHYHKEHSPSSSLLTATEYCHELYPQTRAKQVTNVQLTTLDIALKEEIVRMKREILLKIDVQGFENRVLRGAKQILKACHACIVEVCLDPLYDNQANFFELFNLLHQEGFNYAGNLDQTYGNTGRVIFLDSVFTK